MRIRSALALLFALSAGAARGMDKDVEARVEDLLKRMTFAEKASLTAGADSFATREIKRLKIPALRMSDGPNGVRWGKSTAFPTSIVLASSFDTALAHEVGQALAGELKGRGRNVLLGPCININRHPFGGRNFESLGEDPYLTSRLAVAWIQGLQEMGAGASVKHFAANNQETLRDSIDTRVDERTLREIYLPAFEAAVKEAGSLTVMVAYNRLNGLYCSANPWLMTTVLKQEWGFQGLVMSDWGATHEGKGALKAGLDLEMPGPGQFMGERLAADPSNEAAVTEAARRILRVLYQVGAFDGPPKEKEALVNSPATQALARRVAESGVVLLKNDNAALPLDGKVRRIAVIGPSAAVARTGGGGSSEIDPPYAISALQGLRERYKGKAEIVYAQGSLLGDELQAVPERYIKDLHAAYFDNMELKGEPKLKRQERLLDHNWGQGNPAPGIPKDRFSVRWKGTLVGPDNGVFRLGLRGDDGYRLKIDGKLLLENWGDHAATTKALPFPMEKGKRYAFEVEYYEGGGDASITLGWVAQNRLLEGAIAAAKGADAAVIFTGLSDQFESEGSDRTDFNLPAGQDEMILAVAKANPRTIVVLLAGSPVGMEGFVGQVQGVLQAWFPGMEGGRALAALIAGDANPSGKLPVTLPRSLADVPSADHFPGDAKTVHYEEGLMVGYRHYDTHKVEPRFPFGHGLSYTRFEYSALSVVAHGREADLSFIVKNSGDRAGAEAAQVYVAPPKSKLPRPMQELKAFSKVSLKPGESKQVTLHLNARAFQYWSPAKSGWTADPGVYAIRVGSSSRDIRLNGQATLK